MSDELGANTPLVACMQYTRLCLVAVSASLLARFVLGTPTGEHAAQASAAGVVHAQGNQVFMQWASYGRTALIAVLGAWAGLWLRLPAGALVGPVLVGVLAGVVGVEHGQWPPGVLPTANAIIGLGVGARGDRAALKQAGRSLLPIIGSILLLMVGCALIGWTWVLIVNVDPLSAYLATTPGGIDAVTIAALDTDAAIAVILPVPKLRLLVMVLAGPWVVRWLHRRVSAIDVKRHLHVKE